MAGRSLLSCLLAATVIAALPALAQDSESRRVDTGTAVAMQGDLVFSANSADVLSALCVLGFCFAKSGKIH